VPEETREVDMVRRGLTSERLIALFLFGLVLFLPPLVSTFDKTELVGGIPLLYLYLFVAWAGLIAVTALIVEHPSGEEDLAEGEPAPESGGSRQASGRGM
jgi:hypothetical protein